MGCDNCAEWRWRVQRLESAISDLKEELSNERKKTDDHETVKRERDELQASANRSYDSYVTTPNGMP